MEGGEADFGDDAGTNQPESEYEQCNNAIMAAVAAGEEAPTTDELADDDGIKSEWWTVWLDGGGGTSVDVIRLLVLGICAVLLVGKVGISWATGTTKREKDAGFAGFHDLPGFEMVPSTASLDAVGGSGSGLSDGFEGLSFSSGGHQIFISGDDGRVGDDCGLGGDGSGGVKGGKGGRKNLLANAGSSHGSNTNLSEGVRPRRSLRQHSNGMNV
jgi:hypothetical protein